MRSQGRFNLLFILMPFLMAVPAGAEWGGDYVPGEYVIKLKDQWGALSRQEVAEVVNELNVELKNQMLHSQTIVVKRPMLERAEAVVEELKSHPMVEIVEPNFLYHTSQLPNDSRMGDLWGLSNRKKSVGGVDIDAEDAWSLTTGSRNVVVAVIDTGVNYKHPDLANNMWVNEAEANGQPGVDDDGNGYIDDIHGYDFANKDGDPMDDHDHGSHCAGTIGAEGNNGIGVAGVNWKVRIMGIKFLSNTGGGTLEDAILSIDYATSMKVDVMSNSWGGGGYSENLKQAIERAQQAGILFVAAAGNARNNNDAQPSYPASYDLDNVISVAAVDDKGRLASFSNYGKKSVHIAAPGVNILSTNHSGRYMTMSGTSMATPHVSGVAALLLAYDGHLDYHQLKARLLNTARPLAQLRGKVAHGLLNAYNALANVTAPSDPNDPSHWPSQAQSHSTTHPYADNDKQSFTITQPGASQVAVHFAKFETEPGFDKVTFYDSQGNNLGEYSGNHTDDFSPVAQGESIILELTSDYSDSRYGFDVDQVHHKSEN